MPQSATFGMDAQVLIVGAGPTGLTLAIDLGLRGVRAIVIEQKDAPQFLPKINLCYGCELVSFEQDENCVTAQVKCSDGSSIALRAPYMVGCDGGGSLVRRQLGIKLDGEANIQELRQALYYCEDLYERIP